MPQAGSSRGRSGLSCARYVSPRHHSQPLLDSYRSINGLAELLFTTLETELFIHEHHGRFDTHHQVRLAIFDWIEAFYDRKRRHSALGYLTPRPTSNDTSRQRRHHRPQNEVSTEAGQLQPAPVRAGAGQDPHG